MNHTVDNFASIAGWQLTLFSRKLDIVTHYPRGLRLRNTLTDTNKIYSATNTLSLNFSSG